MCLVCFRVFLARQGKYQASNLIIQHEFPNLIFGGFIKILRLFFWGLIFLNIFVNLC